MRRLSWGAGGGASGGGGGDGDVGGGEADALGIRSFLDNTRAGSSSSSAVAARRRRPLVAEASKTSTKGGAKKGAGGKNKEKKEDKEDVVYEAAVGFGWCPEKKKFAGERAKKVAKLLPIAIDHFVTILRGCTDLGWELGREEFSGAAEEGVLSEEDVVGKSAAEDEKETLDRGGGQDDEHCPPQTGPRAGAAEGTLLAPSPLTTDNPRQSCSAEEVPEKPNRAEIERAAFLFAPKFCDVLLECAAPSVFILRPVVQKTYDELRRLRLLFGVLRAAELNSEVNGLREIGPKMFSQLLKETTTSSSSTAVATRTSSSSKTSTASAPTSDHVKFSNGPNKEKVNRDRIMLKSATAKVEARLSRSILKADPALERKVKWNAKFFRPFPPTGPPLPWAGGPLGEELLDEESPSDEEGLTQQSEFEIPKSSVQRLKRAKAARKRNEAGRAAVALGPPGGSTTSATTSTAHPSDETVDGGRKPRYKGCLYFRFCYSQTVLQHLPAPKRYAWDDLANESLRLQGSFSQLSKDADCRSLLQDHLAHHAETLFDRGSSAATSTTSTAAALFDRLQSKVPRSLATRIAIDFWEKEKDTEDMLGDDDLWADTADIVREKTGRSKMTRADAASLVLEDIQRARNGQNLKFWCEQAALIWCGPRLTAVEEFRFVDTHPARWIKWKEGGGEEFCEGWREEVGGL